MPIIAETTGTLWKIVAQPGVHQVVGAELFVLESMKMEIPVEAQVSGRIASYLLVEGEMVEDGQTVAHFIPD
ncbi:acetyl-CoA carboxylase biotin carboxyl carrier protein subunit [Paraburkholderia sediminicola]|nr:acetyl-CoA carboxylase biotin carboxyl carrier protein subunit [Paraburkholderia sediminicola]